MQQVKEQTVVGWEKESQDKLKLDDAQKDQSIEVKLGGSMIKEG